MDEFVNQNNTQQPENTNGGSTNPTTPPPQQNPYYQNQGFSQQNANYQGNMTYPTSPAGYNTNQQYNPQPQFGTAQDSQYQPQTFNTSPYENPVKKKQSKTGKSVFAILIVLCIAVASILIGISISGDDAQFGNGSSSSQNSQKIEGATPDVEKSPYEAEEYSGKGSMTPTQIYDAVKETNVGILVYYQNQQAGEGSGVIVGEKGGYTYIITCAHVIADKGVDVQVQFHDSTELDADIVGVDSKTDIGVVRVKKTGFKAATFGDSESLKVGTAVYAIGNPGGTEFFGSFTNGIVSSLDRPIATSSNGFYDLPCIQHTAAINPGNSGGALVNEFGQVIGINSSKIADTDYEGMGFAVPSEKVLEVYNEIIEHGYVTNRPMLGIQYYAVSNDSTYSALAWKNNLPYGSIVIASIATNSSLNETNIKVGDIVTAVNGKPLDDTAILLEAIENAKVGDKLNLTVVRLNNAGTVASTFDAEITLVEDKGNTVYQEPVTEQQQQQSAEDYFEQFPFNPFGY
ncbi:MAG: PDZ domain-containing protein [Ruminococcaceae bacterium]|nr:PDZ domain-containing protein [Oscillospiraceae bacterium]